MDEARDQKKPESLLKALDVSGVKSSPFRDNRSADRLYRRAERLVAALFILTTHIPFEEPIKLKIRGTGLEVLGQILEIKDQLNIKDSSQSQYILSGVRILISYVRILAASSYISNQNMEVISSALDDLGSYFANIQRLSASETNLISREDLSGVLEEQNMSIKDIKDTRSKKDTKGRENIAENDAKSEVHARSLAILNVLGISDKLGIKEIAGQLPEYSEKMIQRELARLVDQKRVTKTGSKRWSLYSVSATN